MLVITPIWGLNLRKEPSAFIGFSNEVSTLSQAYVRTDVQDFAANDHRRIRPAVGKHQADHEVVVVLPWVPATAMP